MSRFWKPGTDKPQLVEDEESGVLFFSASPSSSGFLTYHKIAHYNILRNYMLSHTLGSPILIAPILLKNYMLNHNLGSPILIKVAALDINEMFRWAITPIIIKRGTAATRATHKRYCHRPQVPNQREIRLPPPPSHRIRRTRLESLVCQTGPNSCNGNRGSEEHRNLNRDQKRLSDRSPKSKKKKLTLSKDATSGQDHPGRKGIAADRPS
ncbi:RNA helicase family protein [Striga asiatica]|uniref:RNA helicase family protein n=1 Tax=Striga asiatica TaxID=4170 RepID=A0A5A7QQZ5_STRAF|nr:RNA helicase family protein [Striga asiatica]